MEAAFGPPEATGGESRRYRKPSVWKYGDAQFFFDRSVGLDMVQLDTFFGPNGEPVGWGELRLEPWCVREGLPLHQFLAVIDADGFKWQVQREPQYERVIVSLASGVQVGFTTEDELFGLGRRWTAQ